MTEVRHVEVHSLVPAVARARRCFAGAAAGFAGGLVAALWIGGLPDREVSNTLIGLAVVGFFAVVMVVTTFSRKNKDGAVARYGAAVPVEDPAALWQDQDGRRRRLTLDAVLVGMAVALCEVLCVFGHVVFVGLLPVLMFGLWAAEASRAGRWQREHGVVLWQPALGLVGPGAFGRSPYFSTPVETVEVTPEP